MRIIGGVHRGIPLASVGKGDMSAHLRPTTDRIRETLFNVLQGGRFGEVLGGAHVLDLCAGTGALGLEALSRGAQHVTFVDSGRVAQRLISDNIKKLSAQESTAVLKCKVERLPQAHTPCSLVFVDPPYGQNLGVTAVKEALRAGWIAPNALILYEDNTPAPVVDGFACLEQKRYGQTWVSFLSCASL